MVREVRHDGAGALQIRFPYESELVALVKTLPNRRWNAEGRYWNVPEDDAVLIVDLLLPLRFRFDAATRLSYRQLGGTAAIDAITSGDGGAPPETGSQRGLFDAPRETPPVTEEAPERADGDLSVSELNRQVKQAIEAAFPEAVWLIGEISSFNRNAHKRHVSFQLVEQDEKGKTLSSVDATLFEQTRRKVELALRHAGDPFRLEDEVRVRVRARVDLYVTWGAYRVVVEELDVAFTLGEAARRREEIIRQLTEEGLLGRNTSIALADAPLRVGLVTSIGSDAYNDVIRTLQESGFAFEITVHGARVQGRSTEPSVLNALDALESRVGELDVVIVCRGGGSRTDLAWFDSLALGRAVARFPRPVIVGIGHEKDRSVLDDVGWRCKTPTAAAAFLVERVRGTLERIDRLGREVLDEAAARLLRERREGAQRGRRLALAARALLDRAKLGVTHLRERTGRAARTRIASSRAELERSVRGLPRGSAVLLARGTDALMHSRRAIAQAARRDLAAESRRLSEAACALSPRAGRLVLHESERTGARERRLHLVHPRRVVERGYAIMRDAEGTAIRQPDQAPPGARVRAELSGGVLRLRSEGPENERGGEESDGP